VTEGRLVKTVSGTLDQMPFKWIAFMGIDGPYCEDLRQRKDEKSSIERETHCLEEKYSGV